MRPVIWSKKSRRDILESLQYLVKDDPSRAERVSDTIEEAGDKLGIFPTGRPGRVTGTYEKSVAKFPYIIAYTLRSIAGRESIVIVHVILMSVFKNFGINFHLAFQRLGTMCCLLQDAAALRRRLIRL